MAVQQPLKGGTQKLYSVITDFSNGIDKKTTDDVAVDSSFRELKNFYNASEGALSKRPAIYNSHFTDFIDAIVNNKYTNKFNIVTNDLNETKDTVISHLSDFYNTVLKGVKKSNTVSYNSTSEVRYFKTDRIIGFQTFKNNKFLEALSDYENVIKGNYSYSAGTSYIEFSCLVVAGGFSTIKVGTETTEKNKACGLYITRLKFILDYENTTGYTVKIECNSVDPTVSTNNAKRNWLYYPETYNFKLGVSDQYINEADDYIPLPDIDIENYNNFSYMPTGKDYLIKVDQTPDKVSNIFTIIGGENVYAPTPIELTTIGFNILSSNPLTKYSIESTGTDKVRGVFYSVTIGEGSNAFQQPIMGIPYNGKFNIHILKTGSSKPNIPQVRPNNGETDTSKNPYKNLDGNWLDANQTIFQCTGIDTSQEQELKITLGEDNFITYIHATSTSIDETSYISNICKLVYASTRIKIIGEQLVLYGKHGYMFFSEYSVFDYFPNYNYIYVANEAGEESVTSVNYFRQYYAIFTNKRIKKMSGTFGASDFSVSPLNDFIGCPNGKTVRALGNNLFFLGNDGIYKLKQGYIGEGTENVEKVDIVLNNELNLTNVIQAFTINTNYIVIKNDGRSWFVYNLDNNAFYEYNLEASTGKVYKGEEQDEINKKALPFYSVFATNLYDANGDFFIVPMYSYSFNEDFTESDLNRIDLMTFRMSEVPYLDVSEKHKDGAGFISTFETHNLNMGYPTNTKKFKDVYIKMTNESGFVIPLYVTIYVDDIEVISPETYEIRYQKETNTYYYVKVTEKNKELNVSKVLGELTLGEDPIGNKTIQQLKLRIGESGRSIRIILSDGYDVIDLLSNEKGFATRERNLYDFSITSIGIVYKVKKVKEG